MQSEETANSNTRDLVPPKVISQVRPVFPYNLRTAGLIGEVVIAFVVDSSGNVKNPVVVRSNNPWFERPAIDAVLKWRFEPARKGETPVNTKMQVPIHFNIDGLDTSELWSVSPTRNARNLPPELQFDTPPRPVSTTFPVYPFEALVAKKRATVKYGVLVDPAGRVARVMMQGEVDDEFRLAIKAMMDHWRLKPATRDGEPVHAFVGMEVNFSLASRNGGAPVSSSAQAILKELQRSSPRIALPNELDVPLSPLSQRPPVYPANLRAEAQDGEALIEFFVDREGDAQLPRILSSTHPEFGYAAVQTISAWRFSRPLKNGKPVTVRVRIPVKFDLK